MQQQQGWGISASAALPIYHGEDPTSTGKYVGKDFDSHPGAARVPAHKCPHDLYRMDRRQAGYPQCPHFSHKHTKGCRGCGMETKNWLLEKNGGKCSRCFYIVNNILGFLASQGEVNEDFVYAFKASPHRLCREAKDDLVMMLEAEIPDIHVVFKTDVYQPGQHGMNEETLHRMKICVQMPGVKAAAHSSSPA